MFDDLPKLLGVVRHSKPYRSPTFLPPISHLVSTKRPSNLYLGNRRKWSLIKWQDQGSHRCLDRQSSADSIYIHTTHTRNWFDTTPRPTYGSARDFFSLFSNQFLFRKSIFKRHTKRVNSVPYETVFSPCFQHCGDAVFRTCFCKNGHEKKTIWLTSHDRDHFFCRFFERTFVFAVTFSREKRVHKKKLGANYGWARRKRISQK